MNIGSTDRCEAEVDDARSATYTDKNGISHFDSAGAASLNRCNMEDLSEGALKILRRCKVKGFVREGDAIEFRTYAADFSSTNVALGFWQELVDAGLSEETKTRSLKLTVAGTKKAVDRL